MKRNRKAKILSTLGPASSSSDIIEKIFLEGTDVFRLNFSHGTIEEHRKNHGIIRNIEKKFNYPSCILADLQGPKLRVGSFKNEKDRNNFLSNNNFFEKNSILKGSIQNFVNNY